MSIKIGHSKAVYRFTPINCIDVLFDCQPGSSRKPAIFLRQQRSVEKWKDLFNSPYEKPGHKEIILGKPI
jgi:hypothetical protein